MKKINLKTVGLIIKHYRIKAGYTQLELELFLGFSIGTLSRFEKGKVEPKLSTMSCIALALDIDMNLFILALNKNIGY